MNKNIHDYRFETLQRKNGFKPITSLDAFLPQKGTTICQFPLSIISKVEDTAYSIWKTKVPTNGNMIIDAQYGVHQLYKEEPHLADQGISFLVTQEPEIKPVTKFHKNLPTLCKETVEYHLFLSYGDLNFCIILKRSFSFRAPEDLDLCLHKMYTRYFVPVTLRNHVWEFCSFMNRHYTR